MMKTNKALIALVAGMGIIILIGFGALIVGIVMKANDPAFSIFKPNAAERTFTKQFGPPSPEIIIIKIPQGFQIENVTSNAAHLTLHIADEKGREEVLIIEAQTGTLVRRFVIKDQQ